MKGKDLYGYCTQPYNSLDEQYFDNYLRRARHILGKYILKLTGCFVALEIGTVALFSVICQRFSLEFLQQLVPLLIFWSVGWVLGFIEGLFDYFLQKFLIDKYTLRESDLIKVSESNYRFDKENYDRTTKFRSVYFADEKTPSKTFHFGKGFLGVHYDVLTHYNLYRFYSFDNKHLFIVDIKDN